MYTINNTQKKFPTLESLVEYLKSLPTDHPFLQEGLARSARIREAMRKMDIHNNKGMN